jgi:hypothetical protein
MLNTIVDIIQTPIKSFAVSLSGAITGSLPLAVADITDKAIVPTVHFMQYAVWYLTAILALTSIVTWVQRQIDRYRKLHNEVKHNEKDGNDEKESIQ